MPSKVLLILAVLLIPAAGWAAQDPAPLSAKTLYYQAEQDEQAPPAKPEVKQPPASKTPPVTKAPKVGTRVSAVVEHSLVEHPVVEHLGLRYNLLLFDRKSRKGVPVDPDHVFEQGDCLQLQFSPNHTGYLYVFDQGSGGKWTTLLPSALMSDEVNVLRGRETIKVPASYCFTVQNPPGSEHLFVVLSRSQEDMSSLDKAIRAKSQGAPTTMAAKTDKPSSVVEAENRLDAEIQQMRAGLGSRDLGVEKISEPDQPDEPAEAVYVVNTSSVSSSRLVTEILIRHH